MLPLGHLGVGAEIVAGSQSSRELSLRFPIWFLVGTLLSDVIDKGVFYLGGAFLEVSPFLSTRAFGHSGWFLLILLFVSRTRKPVMALLLGVITHGVLDLLNDGLSGRLGAQSAAWVALTYPFNGNFIPLPAENFRDHLWGHLNWKTLTFEALGLLGLWRFWSRYRSLKRTS